MEENDSWASFHLIDIQDVYDVFYTHVTIKF